MSEKIHIWVDDGEGASKAAVPRMSQVTRHVVTSTTGTISENLSSFLKAFEPIAERAASATSSFEVDEIELSLAVNGKGGIELLGKLEAGAEASIKVKLKRKPPPESEK